jgi:hypothetical protein
VTRIAKASMIATLHDEPEFSELFMADLLSRNSRIEEDLIDQLFNSSEKRLALAVLLVGFLMKPREQAGFVLQSNMDVIGSFLSGSQVDSETECLQKCIGTPECNLFSYGKGSACFLYSSGTFRSNSYYNSGRRK